MHRQPPTYRTTGRAAGPLMAAVLAGLLAAAPARAQDPMGLGEPTYGEMVVDGLLLRPLGFVGTVLGTGAWIVTLPFSALGGNAGEAANQLIVKPAQYTFTRPLGDV
ncbi:MAG: hypothetical protein JNM50_04510 [Chromatiales bacterium]|jgi:hypothetical protein|nr:hypothetical protein [Chromatiales bacterium]